LLDNAINLASPYFQKKIEITFNVYKFGNNGLVNDSYVEENLYVFEFWCRLLISEFERIVVETIQIRRRVKAKSKVKKDKIVPVLN
jgi:hypothetical protein